MLHLRMLEISTDVTKNVEVGTILVSELLLLLLLSDRGEVSFRLDIGQTVTQEWTYCLFDLLKKHVSSCWLDICQGLVWLNQNININFMQHACVNSCVSCNYFAKYFV